MINKIIYSFVLLSICSNSYPMQKNLSKRKVHSRTYQNQNPLRKVIRRRVAENNKAIKARENLDDLAWNIGCCCTTSCCIATIIFAWKTALEQQKKNQ